MNFQTLNKQRKFILISAAAGILGMFLPWVSINFGFVTSSVNGMHGWGILAFIAFAGAGIVAYLGDQLLTLDKTNWFIALACGAIAALICIISLFDIFSNGFVNPSFGIWLAVLGALGVVGSAWMLKTPGDDIKSGFDSLKRNLEDKTKQPPTQP